MRVLYLVTNFARWEGDPHSPWLVEQALQLRERGVESAVLAPSYKGLRDHEIYGIPVYRFRYFPSRWEDLTHLEGGPNKIKNPLYLPLILPYMFFGTLAVIRHCRRQRYDVLHVHWPLPQGVFGLAGQNISGARLVTSFHGAELLLTRRYPFLKPVLRYIVKRSDAVSANSSFTASLVRELADVEVKVIPYGSTIVARDVPPIAAGAEPYPEPLGPEPRDEGRDGERRILYVGRLIERKGLPYLIEAMDLLPPGLRVRLDIVGAGDQRPLLESLVKDKGLAERVFFRGRIPYGELAELYAGCDLFVLPAIVDSRGDTEGLGVVLVEVMGYKKPVIATNVGGIPDIVRHNETGILVEQRDPQALAQAIEAVLTDEKRARELGQAGFAYVKEYFSWPRIVDQVMALYSPEAEAVSL
ncbi:MAG: glycosyltransferase family 4 protein [Anaerolineales bacterium]|nr:MAG: glycosyltransferase family 4 protein [Anaerolineales bacterium]